MILHAEPWIEGRVPRMSDRADPKEDRLQRGNGDRCAVRLPRVGQRGKDRQLDVGPRLFGGRDPRMRSLPSTSGLAYRLRPMGIGVRAQAAVFGSMANTRSSTGQRRRACKAAR